MAFGWIVGLVVGLAFVGGLAACLGWMVFVQMSGLGTVDALELALEPAALAEQTVGVIVVALALALVVAWRPAIVAC